MTDDSHGAGSLCVNIFRTAFWLSFILLLPLPFLLFKWRDLRVGSESEKRIVQDRKAMYRQKRDAFRNNATAKDELQHWKEQDRNYTYYEL